MRQYPSMLKRYTIICLVWNRLSLRKLLFQMRERETAQRLIGYSDIQLPVHAEVVVEPERILNFYKTTKIAIGVDGNGETVYSRLPLSGITFDIYFVADLDDYVRDRKSAQSMNNTPRARSRASRSLGCVQSAVPRLYARTSNSSPSNHSRANAAVGN